MENKIEDKSAKPNETIKEHTDKLINQANILKKYNYIKNDNIFEDLLLACKYHDYGKANSEFQKRIKNHTRFNSNNEIPHNILSIFFIDENNCIDYTAVCFAVMYHHYYQDSLITVFQDNKRLIEKFLKEMSINTDVYDDMYDCIDNIGNLFQMKDGNPKKQYAILLKGLLHKCDYSASADINCEYQNNFLNESLKKWQTDSSVQFNELQKFCIQNTDNNIIVSAPTGMGKTEAGLLWCGNNKCFFVLPLKTAINAMYARIKNIFGKEFEYRVALLHSDIHSYYLNDSINDGNTAFNIDYYIRSRQLSLPVTICTPDQIFDFVLKYAGYEYKLATASYSKFIIDEIQMYSPDLLAAIIYAIKTVYNMGGKFAVLTATLPPFVRKELLKIFGKNVVWKDFSSFGNIRHNVKVYEKCLNADDIYRIIQNTANDKIKKFLIVCNSIDTATEIFQGLKKYCSDTDIKINMLHSNFIKADRAEKEKLILSAKYRNEPEIWISTSVIEASLDIDFDILFTELSDLFSLFQRFGRVNRQGKKDYLNTNCFVFTELQGNAKLYHFTDNTVYAYSKQGIMTVDGIITEQEKTNIIEKYLSAEKIEKSEYFKKYNQSFEYLERLYDYEKNSSEALRNIDTTDIIPQPIYEQNKEKIKKAVEIITESLSNKTETFKQMEFLRGLTVSVSRYNMKKTIKYININKHTNIAILENCSYDSEKGLTFKKNKVS